MPTGIIALGDMSSPRQNSELKRLSIIELFCICSPGVFCFQDLKICYLYHHLAQEVVIFVTERKGHLPDHTGYFLKSKVRATSHCLSVMLDIRINAMSSSNTGALRS